MFRAQSGPDSHYLYVVARKPRATRRSRRASNLDVVNLETPGLVAEEEERVGSLPKALLIGLPVSAALWALIIWAAVHVL